MKSKLEKKLKGTGWQVGNASDFLQLSLLEAAIVEIRLALADAAKKARLQHDLSQTELAKLMLSSQSRVAKIETADPSVSIDLMIQAMLAAGAKVKDVGRALTA